MNVNKKSEEYEWINICLLKPLDGKYYLFVYGDRLPFVGLWTKEKGCTVDGEYCNPTHWMPLPKSPQRSK